MCFTCPVSNSVRDTLGCGASSKEGKEGEAWGGPTSAVLVGQEYIEKVETITQGDCGEAVPAVCHQLCGELCHAVGGQLMWSKQPSVVLGAWRGPREEAVQHWAGQGGGAVPGSGRAGPVGSCEDVQTPVV